MVYEFFFEKKKHQHRPENFLYADARFVKDGGVLQAIDFGLAIQRQTADPPLTQVSESGNTPSQRPSEG